MIKYSMIVRTFFTDLLQSIFYKNEYQDAELLWNVSQHRYQYNRMRLIRTSRHRVILKRIFLHHTEIKRTDPYHFSVAPNSERCIIPAMFLDYRFATASRIAARAFSVNVVSTGCCVSLCISIVLRIEFDMEIFYGNISSMISCFYKSEWHFRPTNAK